MAWKTVKIGDFLKRTKDPISIEADKEYSLVTIKMHHKWVVPRWKKIGNEIGSKTMYKVRSWQFILSGIDARHGAFWIIPDTLDGAVVTNDFWYFDLDEKIIDLTFFYHLTSMSGFIRLCRNASDGTTNRIRLQKDKFFSQEILIPDMESQLSIVEKLKLLSVDISTLDFINKDTSEKVASLRLSILQDAIQGKLVPQNPSDEPASVLLGRIQQEKEELVKTGKIKKQKKLPSIKPEEIPFELPDGWEWVRLGELLLLSEYWSAEKANIDESGVPMFRMGNIQKWSLHYNDFKYLNRNAKDLPKLYLKRNDLLFNRTNSYELVGKTGIFLWDDDSYTFAGYLIRLRSSFFISPILINYYLNSDFFRKTQIEPQIIQQCGQANFSGGKLIETLCPLPPASEQVRIVEKVNELFTYCDTLESSTKNASEASGKLLESVLGMAFNV